jgi:hypothetical protein
MSIAWNENAAAAVVETLEFSPDASINRRIKLAVSGLQKAVQKLFLEFPTEHDKEQAADFILASTKQENITLSTRRTFVIVALALLGAVAVTVLIIAPLAEAGCEKGKALSIAFNASKGRCFRP